MHTQLHIQIPPEFITSCEKGAKAACETGVLAGYTLSGVRVAVTDGAAHAVDSNDLSFQLAMRYGIRQGVLGASPQILEPVMSLEVEAPGEFQVRLCVYMCMCVWMYVCMCVCTYMYMHAYMHSDTRIYRDHILL